MPLEARYSATERITPDSLINLSTTFSLPSEEHLHILFSIAFFLFLITKTHSKYTTKKRNINRKGKKKRFFFGFELDFPVKRRYSNYSGQAPVFRLPTWRNGRRAAFRSQSFHEGEGSSPFVGTTFKLKTELFALFFPRFLR